MALGRTFDTGEGLNSNIPLAVISYQSWQKHFLGAENILEQKLTIRGVSFKVIGVTAKDFIEPQIYKTGYNTDLWLPFDYTPFDQEDKQSWSDGFPSLLFVGKLAQNITTTQAEQLLSPIVNNSWQQGVAGLDFFAGWKKEVKLTSLQSVILAESEQTIYFLLLGVIGLALIAGVNITNLFISRTAQQQRQLAIYAALGAKKSQLFKLVLAESGILMLLSVSLALLVASMGFAIFQQYLASLLPRVDELSLNTITFTIACLLVGLFALFFAWISCHIINYRALNSMLQTSGKGTGVQVSKGIRFLLIISQVAIATSLIFINISLFNGAINDINRGSGINTDNIFDLDLSTSRPPTQKERDGPILGTAVFDQLSLLPQVEAVSNALSPISGFDDWALTNTSNNEHFAPEYKRVDDQYFKLIHQPLIEGDYFTEFDSKDNTKHMIINDVLAKHLAPQGSALGLKIASGFEEVYTITGVVKGMRLPGSKKIPMRVYTPSSVHSINMMIKVKAHQQLTREQAVSAIAKATSLFAVYSLDKVDDLHQKLLFSQYTTAITTAVLALLTIFLASIGLYGILSYSSQVRRFEIGTRLALGAKRYDIISLIIRDNMLAIGGGIIAGLLILLALYLAFAQVLTTYLSFEQVVAMLMTLLLIGIISLFACYWPLRQFINRPANLALRGA